MENLFATFLLDYHGFCHAGSYDSLLNDCFLHRPDSGMLLELEENASDDLHTLRLFDQYWRSEPGWSFDAFAKTLLAGLREAYQTDKLSMEEFGQRCYRLWNDLPDEWQWEEPLCAFGYGDDYLWIDDTLRMRKLYEGAFAWYGEKEVSL